MRRKSLILLSSVVLLSACNNTPITISSSSIDIPTSSSEVNNSSSNHFYDTDKKSLEITKEEYFNKTLGGLLGQFAGFLSGYEFVFKGADPYVGMPEDWFDFINGPYAGNYDHYYPGAYASGENIYNRLKVNPETNLTEVASDDDYHIDIFNQTIIDEFGTSSYAIKEAWKKYIVSDWGGGADAMALIKSKDMLAPFTGTIESGNRYGWCTEAYIENETLGMNAPGMPNVASLLIDKFASNVGYFDSIIWAKFYGVMYSLAYFDSDVKSILKEASKVLPQESYPFKMYNKCIELYNNNPNDYHTALNTIVELRRPLYRLDNIQTDPNVNGAFAIISLLYGNNEYLKTTKIASIAGFDGDCTAAIVAGLMGVIKGYKSSNEEYQKINDLIYHDGKGTYFNDTKSSYPPCIKNTNYPERMKIDDIVKLYQKNFEKILKENGGSIDNDKYIIETTSLYNDHSYLFTNYDGEERNLSGFKSSGCGLESLVESDLGNVHSGYGCFKATNVKSGKVFHQFNNLNIGSKYRLSLYAKTSENTQVNIFASDGKNTEQTSFANIKNLINKSFVFTATSDSMDVGLSFNENALDSDYVIFDDFMLEEINQKIISKPVESELKIYTNQYMKSISCPSSYENKEVTILIEVRSYSGSSLNVEVFRNGNEFGGILISNSSKNSLSGRTVVEIPYVFEKDSDLIKLSFENNKIMFGNVEIVEQTQYMFR